MACRKISHTLYINLPSLITGEKMFKAVNKYMSGKLIWAFCVVCTDNQSDKVHTKLRAHSLYYSSWDADKQKAIITA